MPGRRINDLEESEGGRTPCCPHKGSSTTAVGKGCSIRAFWARPWAKCSTRGGLSNSSFSGKITPLQCPCSIISLPHSYPMGVWGRSPARCLIFSSFFQSPFCRLIPLLDATKSFFEIKNSWSHPEMFGFLQRSLSLFSVFSKQECPWSSRKNKLVRLIMITKYLSSFDLSLMEWF